MKIIVLEDKVFPCKIWPFKNKNERKLSDEYLHGQWCLLEGEVGNTLGAAGRVSESWTVAELAWCGPGGVPHQSRPRPWLLGMSQEAELRWEEPEQDQSIQCYWLIEVPEEGLRQPEVLMISQGGRGGCEGRVDPQETGVKLRSFQSTGTLGEETMVWWRWPGGIGGNQQANNTSTVSIPKPQHTSRLPASQIAPSERGLHLH